MRRTSHSSDGRLRAFLDGETSEVETLRIQEHLEECGDCRRRRDELVQAEDTVREALGALTSDPDLEAARRSLERRRGREPASATRRRPALARAATVALLLIGGVAAGLPGSPVRQWLGHILDAGSGSESIPSTVSQSATPETERANTSRSTEIRVEPNNGSILVELTGTESGTRVRITLTDDESAGVVAGTAARFGSGAGRIGVEGAGGEVRVEIPRSAVDATVTANGRLLLRKERNTLNLPSTNPDTAGAEMLFVVPSDG